MHFITNKRGGYERPSLLLALKPYAKALFIGSFIGFIAVGSFRAVKQAGNVVSSVDSGINSGQANSNGQQPEISEESESTCKEVDGTTYPTFDCTDEATKAKVYEAAKKGITWHYQEEKQNTFKASVTKYSRKDSCHNPKGKACLTASGEDTKEGRTVACPRSLKLGTKVLINGKTYTCLDRTAKWVEQKFGPTYDIFTEDHDAALRFGRKTLEVAILK